MTMPLHCSAVCGFTLSPSWSLAKESILSGWPCRFKIVPLLVCFLLTFYLDSDAKERANDPEQVCNCRWVAESFQTDLSKTNLRQNIFKVTEII